MKKNTYYVAETHVLDPNTGEVATIETTKKQKITIEADTFYMTFIDFMAPLFKITNGTVKNVLSELCRRAEFNTGKVSISTKDKEDICEKLEISKNSLCSSLKNLVENKLLIGEKGTYTINPQIFWRGDLARRNALLNTREIQIAFSFNPQDAGFTAKGKEVEKQIEPNKEFEQ